MRLLFFLLLTFMTSLAYSQNLKFGTGITYGTYSMKGLKEFQRETLPALSFVPVKIVESFPATIGYDIHFSFSKGKFMLGGYYSFASTGGRIHYKDYSGEIKFDQIVSGKSVGASTVWKINSANQYNIVVGFRTGITISNLLIDNTISVNDQSDVNQSYLFKSLNLTISPLIEVEYPLGGFIIYAATRYEANVAKSGLNLNGNDDVFIELDSGENLKADWEGLRISAGVKYKINLSKP
jgi:hypothetical protein